MAKTTAKKPDVTSGLIASLPDGTFRNITYSPSVVRPYFTSEETLTSLVTKLNNEPNTASSADICRGLVCKVEAQPDGGMLSELFSFFDTDAQKKVVAKTAYVYIDRIQGSYAWKINDTNMQSLLTSVPIYGDDPITIGMLIEVSVSSSNPTQATFIKKVTTNAPRQLTPEEIRQIQCNSPSAVAETPDPASEAREQFRTDRVGYVQAIFVLSKWLADQKKTTPNLDIAEIIFPFKKGTKIGQSTLEQYRAQASLHVAGIMKDKKSAKDPNKQWIKYAMDMLRAGPIKYEKNDYGAIVVKLSGVSSTLPYIKFLNWGSNYIAQPTKPHVNEPRAFLFVFPRNAKSFTTKDMMALTQSNWGNFIVQLETAWTPPIVESAPQSPTVRQAGCAERYEGDWTHDTQLTEHFKVRELDRDAVANKGTTVITKKGTAETISGEQLTTNIKQLATTLEKILTAIHEKYPGARVTITPAGGYQPSWETAGPIWKKKADKYGELGAGKVIGGDGHRKGRSSDGQHRRGKAADIQVSGVSPAEVWFIVKNLMVNGVIKNGGLGYYPGFIHYDIRNSYGRWFHTSSWKKGDGEKGTGWKETVYKGKTVKMWYPPRYDNPSQARKMAGKPEEDF